jgi:hypothetical protein
MTKDEWIGLIQNRFPDVHGRIIELHIGRAINTIIYEVFRQDMTNLDLYARPYTVSVQKDEDSGIYYSILPSAIVQLPDCMEGVRRIYLAKGSKVSKFIPIPRDSWDVFNNSDVSKVSPLIGYSVQPTKVMYMNNPDTDTVCMDLVIPFENYDYDDQVHIPSGQDERLIQLVETFINGTPMPDKIND